MMYRDAASQIMPNVDRVRIEHLVKSGALVPVEVVPMEYEGGGEGWSTWRETTGAPDGWLVKGAALKEGT